VVETAVTMAAAALVKAEVEAMVVGESGDGVAEMVALAMVMGESVADEDVVNMVVVLALAGAMGTEAAVLVSEMVVDDQDSAKAATASGWVEALVEEAWVGFVAMAEDEVGDEATAMDAAMEEGWETGEVEVVMEAEVG